MFAITANPIGAGQSFVISDGQGQRGPGGKLFVNDFQFTFGALVQRANYLNSASSVNIVPNSPNQSADIPLEVEYEFDSQGKVLQFIRELQTNCPVIANVTITAGGYSATAPKVYLRPIRGRTIGEVSLRVMYPLTFGMFLAG